MQHFHKIVIAVGVLIILGLIGSNEHYGLSPNSTPTTRPASPVWEYTNGEDDMRNQRWWEASLQSENAPELDFPYQGGSPVWLVLHNKEGDPPDNSSPTLVLEKGQYDCHSYDYSNLCVISVSIDGGEPIELTGARDDCGKNQCLDLTRRAEDEVGPGGVDTHAESVVSIIRRAKTLTIEVPLYRFGFFQYHFKPAGLVFAPQTDRV